ncbi:OmpA family protein [Rhodoferax sp.]|uniref:OmpA family protein n=1 Tax=Rhodoferax sp. TaxID=50421 RepID=UPI0026053E9B|nr:OmpA family protein [Rhodoferax sp.]MDD2924933.1 OmpA family protein [Rhodoferax sp.]
MPFSYRSLLVGLVAALMVLLSPAHAASDPADAESTTEHPEVSRFPGFYIDNSKHNDFNEFSFSSKNRDRDGQPVGELKAGQYWFIDYILKDGARQPSAVELIRNYENAFRKLGGSMVYRDPPESAVYRMPLGRGGERWVQINIDAEGARYQLNIVDVAAMAQKVEFSASEMADALKKQGHVALTGILFDTGKASIKPQSEALLKEVLTVLTNDKALNLAIEGHTDNVGNAKANAELSRRRAEAVVAYLVAHGIQAQRLKASGKGDSVPVADNRTEDGRARNRRVELVKF